MKTKIKFWICPIILIGLFFILVTSCKKDNESTTESKTTAIFNPDKTYGTMTDIDGNVYKTITIGTQIWMAENLRTTHYRDGSAIPNVTDNSNWTNLTTGAYCWYANDIINQYTYGAIYNYYTVLDNRNLCPLGWHVPTEDEWITLATYLGGESLAGGKLKEVGTTHWQTPNTGATNESGFTALPSGYRNGNGPFVGIGLGICWWSATSQTIEDVYNRNLDYNSSAFTNGAGYMRRGLYIRCVKD